jgi:energy-coupling factor transporter transmembrane protein EcfT
MSDRRHRDGKKRRGGKAREKLRFVPGESFIHRLDPRTKIFLLMAFTTAALLTVNPVLNLAILFMLLPLAVPAVVCLIYRSRNVSSAMLCRGYGHAGRPTLYSRLRLGPGDWVVLAGILCGAIALAGLNWIKL